MILTVELKKYLKGQPEEVAICCDQQGLELLIAKLQHLVNKHDHLHLMTPSWAGNDLTEIKQGGDNYELIQHLRLVKI